MPTPALHYTPLRFFRVMWAILWAAFAHPFSSTIIDLETGTASQDGQEQGQ